MSLDHWWNNNATTPHAITHKVHSWDERCGLMPLTCDGNDTNMSITQHARRRRTVHRNAVRLMGRHSDERGWFFDKKRARSLSPDPAAQLYEITTRCVGCMACLFLPPTRHWPCTLHPPPHRLTPSPAPARRLVTLARMAGTYGNSGTVGRRYVRLMCFIVLESSHCSGVY